MAAKKRLKLEPDPIGEKLLTLREAAAVLRMNPRTLRAYLRRGQIEDESLAENGGSAGLTLSIWGLKRKDEHEE